MKQIPKLIFGKSHLVKDEHGFLDEVGYKKENCIVYPAIQGSQVTVEVTMYTDTPITPFTSGSEFYNWANHNCDKCRKWADSAGPEGLRSQGGCPLEIRLAIAYMDDGKIPFKTAKRIGYDNLVVQRNGAFVSLTDCKEKEDKA